MFTAQRLHMARRGCAEIDKILLFFASLWCRSDENPYIWRVYKALKKLYNKS